MAKIFVNYRRDDTRSDAARIRDRLVTTFGRTNVFMDVDNLLAGQRFDQELAKALNSCDVLLAVMGHRWSELFRARLGTRDYVREEIAEALARGIVVIPVLIERAPLPSPDQLPPDIRALVLHQKHDVSHDRFGRDVEELVAAIKTARKVKRGGAGSRAPAVAAGAFGVIAALGGLAYGYSALIAPSTSQPPAQPPVRLASPSPPAAPPSPDPSIAAKAERDRQARLEAEQALAKLERDMAAARAKQKAEEDERRRQAQRDAVAKARAEDEASMRGISLAGAPGDGNTALLAAMRKALVAKSISLLDARGQSRRVAATVKLVPASAGKQSITIEWRVFDATGKHLGTVNQKNQIPAGSLDGAWGASADAAANAAADGIGRLLAQK